ncbi:MAG: glycosyltransferase [Bacteroidales bacterium]|nr:glycosyltransferase [Bacteroidales bacterium]
MNNIAIIAVAYNRVDSLSRLLKSLDLAYYEEDVTLIISVDKSNTDIVERFADKYEWKHGKKIVDKHEKNLGLRSHMMSLGKWFDEFDAIVVLEDDIVVSPNFYTYTKQTVEKYSFCQNIAGISLYGFSINYQIGLPFQPIKDEHDVYFMNCAMSWGEVWMRDSWKKFYEWYLSHQDFPMMKHLPRSICLWNQKSWLKYHTRYCIEENKYFVHPYTSLCTNFGDAGEHSDGTSNTIYQVPMQCGKKTSFLLPDFDSKAVFYDGFFENIELYNLLGYTPDELCIDLQGEWHNRLNKRYWLTTEVEDYKIVRSFDLNYRPIELNVLNNNEGNQIFLYDTSVAVKNSNKKNRKSFLYRYHLSNMFYFVRSYGFGYALKDFVEAIKKYTNNIIHP